MNFKLRKQLKQESGQTLAAFVCTVLLGTAVLMVAQAQERELEFKPRVYAGAGVGVTRLEPKMPNDSLSVSEDSSTGFHGVIGYDFTSRFAAEVYYADLGSADIAFLGADVGKIDYQVFGLSGIAYLYNSRSGLRAGNTSSMGTREGLSLFGRVGIGGVSADSELDYTVNHRTHLALGLGAEYGFRNGFALRGEYRAFDSDAHYASLSLIKRFGKASQAVVPVAAVAAPKAIVPEAPKASVVPEKPAFTGVPTVYFAFDKSVISDTAANKLDEVVAAVADSDARLVLEGHTDWVATERYNYDLSLRRSENVRRYLESKGIARSRMSVRGFGETRPIASNTTAEGRASNRRVDIRIE